MFPVVHATAVKSFLNSELLLIHCAITFEEEQLLLNILKSVDLEWQNIDGKWATLEKRRHGWGDSPVDARNEVEIPEVIKEIGRRVRALFVKHVSDIIPEFTSCTANRYPVGEGLGLHNDGRAWIPFVMGITLNSARHMEFYNPHTQERLVLQTPRLSAYLFFGDVYKVWNHASIKGAKNGKYYQYSTAYSLTFRRADKSWDGPSYERTQNQKNSRDQ